MTAMGVMKRHIRHKPFSVRQWSRTNIAGNPEQFQKTLRATRESVPPGNRLAG